ncbi:MAG: ribose-phosphate pyrophosphokinase [Peptococcaceae bacterium]|jgi:ribose-phosphate pyrophosphokinase|nr:ribose-phosphate pyrophosphokinase [Peptococcaceae bacterium]
MSDTALQIFTGNANPELAQEIVEFLGMELSKAKVSKFKDGEVRLEINESVRGNNVFIIQPTCAPVNENLMELLIMVDAIRRASAKSITTVIPYYGYARQERKQKPREPISAKLVANLLTAAGADRMVTIDLHTSSIQGFFDIPVDHMPAVPLLANYYREKQLENVVVVSPDIGGVTRARNLAERLNCTLAIIDKRRPEPNKSEIMGIIGDVRGKNVIIVDDMIDTAGTITNAANFLSEQAGANEVYACCTHAVFTPPAVERIQQSSIKEMLITNTIPLTEEEKQCAKIQTVSIAPLLGRTIEFIHNKKSVSGLFD